MQFSVFFLIHFTEKRPQGIPNNIIKFFHPTRALPSWDTSEYKYLISILLFEASNQLVADVVDDVWWKNYLIDFEPIRLLAKLSLNVSINPAILNSSHTLNSTPN